MTEADKAYVKALLEELIACDTTDYHEENGQRVVERELSKLNCIVKRVNPKPDLLAEKYSEFNEGHTYENRDCLIAGFAGAGGGKSLILNAHMDTVFPAQPAMWKTDPFSPVERSGKLYGLGSCDTKAGLSAMITALRMIQKEGRQLKGDVYFHCVVDEEAGGGNGTLACLNESCRADAVLVAEPTGLRPAGAHMGSYAARITAEGRSVHGNLKQEGVNAIEKMLPIINACYKLGEKWEQRSFGLLPAPVFSVVSLSAGDGSITLPGVCTAVINFTYLPDGYEYKEEFLDMLHSCEKADPWFADRPLRIEKLHDVRPYHMAENSVWGDCAVRNVSEVLGRQTDLFGFGCGADARFYANTGKMDTIILGPGNILNAHSPNEFVELEQLYDAVRIYYGILCDWCG